MTEVESLSLPTPFQVGSVNCYLIDVDELTLIDPGPATTDATEALDEKLRERGYEPADVENILITHPHLDHAGGAARIASRGAQVIAHEDAVARLSKPQAQFQREQRFFTEFLLERGVPEEIATSILGLPESYTMFQKPVTPDRTVDDDERIDIGLPIDSRHTPGHAVGSMCYALPTIGGVLTGDHVLPNITPNPILTLAPRSTDRRTRSLPTYLTALEELRNAEGSIGCEIEDVIGYPGHGDPIPELSDRIDETIAHHEERKETVADILAESGPMSPYELVGELFPELPTTDLFTGMSEAIGHLDLLEDEDRLEWTIDDGVKRCSLAE